MGAGAVVGGQSNEGFAQFLNPNRRWYNNKRLIYLHCWIGLLYVF